jgi:hypothetical protein
LAQLKAELSVASKALIGLYEGRGCKATVFARCDLHDPYMILHSNSSWQRLIESARSSSRALYEGQLLKLEITVVFEQTCFPRGALLRQGDFGDSVKMHSLKIGSKIVGANGTNPASLFVGHSARSRLPFSPAGQLDTVTNFIHRDENITSTFLRLHTPKGALELSPNHLLFARNGSSTQSVLARDVRIGTTLLHRDGEAMVIDPCTPGCCAHVVAAQLAACGR